MDALFAFICLAVIRLATYRSGIKSRILTVDYWLYAGQIENLLHLNFPLCVTQAAMVYGSPAMISVSSLIFVLHVNRRQRRKLPLYGPDTFP
jgi:hypothetical protein